MFKLIGVSFILAVIQISESAPVYQFLPPRDGYVPVYIRLGDTPLDEINPELALAFHENNIHTRNVNDLEEQMLNDARTHEDLSESIEDVKPIQKDVSSEEEIKSEKLTSPISSKYEPISEEKPVSSKKISENDKESEEVKDDVDSEEKPSLINLRKNDESDEIVVATYKSKSDDQSSEEVTKSKRDVPVFPSTEANTSDSISSEENDETVVEKKVNISNESSEGVVDHAFLRL